MRNFFPLFTALVFTVAFNSCKKEKQVVSVQEREVQYYASLIPIKLDIDKKLKVHSISKQLMLHIISIWIISRQTLR